MYVWVQWVHEDLSDRMRYIDTYVVQMFIACFCSPHHKFLVWSTQSKDKSLPPGPMTPCESFNIKARHRNLSTNQKRMTSTARIATNRNNILKKTDTHTNLTKTLSQAMTGIQRNSQMYSWLPMFMTWPDLNISMYYVTAMDVIQGLARWQQ